MSYAQLRKEQEERSQNHDRVDHTWEEQNCDVLHSGFIQPSPRDEAKSTLFLSLWFTQGHYQCKILDRSTDEKTFTRIESLGTIWTELDEALKAGTLDWTPDVRSRNGSEFR